MNEWRAIFSIEFSMALLLQAGDLRGRRRERRRVGRRAFDGVAEYLGGERILGISAWEFGDLVMQKSMVSDG